MGSTYELYKGLRNLQASKIVKKDGPSNPAAANFVQIKEGDVVSAVLKDGEEVYFELES